MKSREMQNQEEYLLVTTACPEQGVAIDLANKIVDAKLAACVNIVPTVISVYKWQGQKEQADESLLLIKTSQGKYSALQALIVAHHPYELPEVIAVPINSGLPDYLAWISDSIE